MAQPGPPSPPPSRTDGGTGGHSSHQPPAATTGPDDSLRLQASYSSPSNAPFALTKTLPALSSPHARHTAAFLAALGQALAQTQADVNAELTSRMEDDKAAAGAPAAAEDDDDAAENYGEEVEDEADHEDG